MKHTKKLTATALALAIASASSAVAFAENDGGGGSSTTFSATVTADVQKDGAFLIVPQEMTISSDKAEKYGFTDSEDGVTMLDAIITMHELEFGEAFTPETVGNYLTTGYNSEYDYYYISTSFGVPAPNGGYSASGYFINNKMVSLTAEKALVKDGDTVEYAFYTDTEMYTDAYTAFRPSKAVTYAGQPVSLNMYMHEMIMWYPDNELEPISDEYDFEAMTINTVNADGSLSEALTDADKALIVPDEKGIVTLTFDEPGTYIVTASGFIGEDYPVIAPYCFVTVKPVYELENIKISASATVKKKDGAEDAKIILAVYDKNGILTDSNIKTAENGEISFDISIPNDSRVKMFIWDDENGMKPLAPIN